MNHKQLYPMMVIVVFAALLTGCATAAEPSKPVPSQPSSEIIVTPTETSTPEIILVQSSAQAEQNARLLLADHLKIQIGKINVIGVEVVEWSDACLGVHRPDIMCAQVITPGYRIQLKANDVTYEVHTNSNGSSTALVETQETTGSILVWKLKGESCQGASFGLTGVQLGCTPQGDVLPYAAPQRGQQLQDAAWTYIAFNADTPVGTVTFNGSGPREATPTEQRRLAEWARMVNDEAAAGKSKTEAGLAIRWTREGGIAGFCDDLAIYRDGTVKVASCKSAVVQITLGDRDLDKIYGWLDGWAKFEAEQKDQAAADSMTERWIFNGVGTQTASTANQQQVLDFLRNLAAEAAQTTTTLPSGSLENAQTALSAFFRLLSERRFSDAVLWYGGSMDVLTGYNPDVPPDRQAVLFDRGCSTNGLVCMPIFKVLKAQAVSKTEFHFTVQFTSADGTVFAQGPCCGEDPTSKPPVTDFEYSVRWQDGRYKVQELPPYVP